MFTLDKFNELKDIAVKNGLVKEEEDGSKIGATELGIDMWAFLEILRRVQTNDRGIRDALEKIRP